MNRIQKSAQTFIKENKITLSNITSVEFLTEIALKYDYRVYKFENYEEKLFKRLNIKKQPTDSFTYNGNNLKCIFVKQLREKHVAALLLHELAHICLGHLTNAVFADSDETEADMFVSYIREEIYCKKIGGADDKKEQDMKNLDDFLKNLYKSECIRTEHYRKCLIISLTANVIMLLTIIIKWICT